MRQGSVVLLEGGLVVDGSGSPGAPGDVLVIGDRIARVGEALRRHLPAGLGAADLDVVDCRGRVVAPGFIDAHTHDDAAVLRAPGHLVKLSQGVTTVVTGNCGISLAPYCTAKAPAPLTLLGSDVYHHPSMAAYRQAVEAARPAVNVAALVGHTTLRFATMSDLSRPAAAPERARMVQLLDECMRSGAFGLSSGLFYEEANAAPADEVIELAQVAARHGGIYATHLRSEMETILDALKEAGDCAFEARLPLVLSHHKCAGPANWGRTRETLPFIDHLGQRQAVAMDVYPYLAGSTVLREDLVDGVIDVLITWSGPYPEMTGRKLADIAAEWGVSQRAAAVRLKPGGACYFQMCAEDVDRVITHPRSMIGSDGLPHDRHPHPRLWGTFPRVLARYWRERHLLTLEQAVHKMTGLTAHNFGIPDRGLLRAGGFADIVVFDPERVADTSTYEHPTRQSVGIDAVFVNGHLSYRTGTATGALRASANAGRMLRPTRAAA